MNIKVVLLMGVCLIANKDFAQRRNEYICASDTGKVKIEAGFYILQPLVDEPNGLKAPNSDIPYCIKKDCKVALGNIDSVSTGFEKYSKSFTLEFHFNKMGTEQLSVFSKKYLGQDVGLFIINRLVSAARITSTIEHGNMTLQGGFSESQLLALKKEIETAAQEQRR